MIGWLRREPRTLRIDLPGRKITLHPHDVLWLTHDGWAEMDGHCRVKAEVTHKYTWDGKVLRNEGVAR